MYEYEIYQHRSAELRELAAHQRLATEARRIQREAHRAARANRRPGPLGRLIGGRLSALHANQAPARLGEC